MIYKALISGATYAHDDGDKSIDIFNIIYSGDHTDIFDDVDQELETHFKDDDSEVRFFMIGVAAEYVESGNGYDLIETDIEYEMIEFESLSEVSDFINNNK